MPKTKGEITKERIIAKSAKLFLEHGYSNTGLSEILKAAEIPKGAFYFHFKSKNELGVAVGEYFSDELSTWFARVLDETSDWRSFVEQLAAEIHKKIEDGVYFGCPFSCFGTETAVIDPAISEVCTRGINRIGEIFTMALFRHKRLTKEEIRKGFTALSVYEGFLVYFRISHEEITIDRMKDALLGMEEKR